MRKIEKEMLNAIYSRRNWKKGNTEVVATRDEVSVYLHGNKIWRKVFAVGGVESFSLCGWNTPTTKSRLNALGCNIMQKNYQLYANGEKINANSWHFVKYNFI